jgi:hypothetical protein
MSQEKVQRRKEKKLNMKKDVRKRKIQRRISAVIGTVIAILLIVWVGFSIEARYTAYRLDHHDTVKVDLSEITNFKLD